MQEESEQMESSESSQAGSAEGRAPALPRAERKQGAQQRLSTNVASLARSFGSVKRRTAVGSAPARRPRFVADIVIASGGELKDRLLEQGLSPEEVILKYCWPRYAPPREAGIRSMAKSENLGAQFGRLIALHREAPAAFPMPVGTVSSAEGEFVGYILEYVPGETLRTLLAMAMLGEARRQLALVETTVSKLHAKGMPHGDLNPSNIIAADDGRTVLIDPVANPRAGTLLQDALCLAQMRQEIEAGSTARG